MAYPSVVCPHCGKEIEISQALTHSIEERISRQFEENYRKRFTEAEARIREKALSEVRPELDDLKMRLLEKETKLKESENAELQLRKEKEDILARESQLDLEVARKVEEERGKITSVIEARKDHEYKLKEAARDRLLEDLKGQLEMQKKQEDLLLKQVSEN
jgi:hypothetical protein